MTDETTRIARQAAALIEELLPCPFCGGECVQPQGWTGTNMKGERTSGPACDKCGATTETTADWNRRADLGRPSLAGDERVARLVEAAAFLCDRLNDFELCEDNAERMVRDYLGHVDPAYHRLTAALSAMNTPAQGGEE